MDVSSLDLTGARHYLLLQCSDILDRRSNATVMPISAD